MFQAPWAILPPLSRRPNRGEEAVHLRPQGGGLASKVACGGEDLTGARSGGVRREAHARDVGRDLACPL